WGSDGEFWGCYRAARLQQWILRFRRNSDDVTEIIGYHPVLWRGTECKSAIDAPLRRTPLQDRCGDHLLLRLTRQGFSNILPFVSSDLVRMGGSGSGRHSPPYPGARTDGIRAGSAKELRIRLLIR